MNALTQAANVVRKWLRGFRRSEPLDMAKIHQLRAQGLSWREVAQRLPGKPPHNTVFVAYQKWERAHPEPVHAAITLEPKPVVTLAAIQPAEPPKPSVSAESSAALFTALRSLEAPVKRPAPIEAPKLVEPSPEPEQVVGFDGLRDWTSMPDGRREFLNLTQDTYPVIFLTDDETNAEMAWNCCQPAIAVDTWNDRLAEHPAIKSADRILIVLLPDNVQENHRLLAAVSRSPLRAKCFVCTMPNAVPSCFKIRLQSQREAEHNGWKDDDASFLQVYRFKPLPAPSRVQGVLPKEEKPEPWVNLLDYRPSWEIPRMRR